MKLNKETKQLESIETYKIEDMVNQFVLDSVIKIMFV